VRGLRPDDAVDAFVLEGRVPDQAALTRALLVAAAALDPDLLDAGIEVVADESGGLRSGNVQQNANQANQPFAATGQGSGVFQGGGGGQANQIDNRIRSNLARAAAVSAADGRVLSFLRVVELPQVRVDVEIYELDRSRLDQLDVSLEAVASDFGQGALSGLDTPLEASPLVGSVSPADAQGVLSLIDGAGSAGFQLADSRAAVSATLRALTSNGYARSLARPSLTVLSGELAQFQVGGEVPIPTAFATQVGDGAQGVFNGVDFRAFGVRLVARPLVEPDGRITLDLVPEVVRPDTELTTAIRDATGTSPATVGFESRALRTTARVNRGGALIIGGLLQRSEQGSASGVPGLSRLPLIGWMFGRDSQQSAMSELVIVVAPSQVFEPRPRARVWAHADPLDLVLGPRPEPLGDPDGGPASDPAADPAANSTTPALDGNSPPPSGILPTAGPTGQSTPEAPTLTETRT
jgi:Flp pilus assembly secretin CpaC